MVINTAVNLKHEVFIVTMRTKGIDDIKESIPKWHGNVPVVPQLKIIYCDGNPKKGYAKVHHNLEFDVWIDDKPESVHKGSDYTAKMLEHWREQR